MTNKRDEKIHVRRGDKWMIEDDYSSTFRIMANSVPRHLQFLFGNDDPVKLMKRNGSITDMINSGILPNVVNAVLPKLRDLTYSYTKNIVITKHATQT